MLIFEHYFPVTDQVSGMLFVGITLSGTFIPWAAGQFLDAFPLVLVAVSMASSVLCWAIFFALSFLDGAIRKRL